MNVEQTQRKDFTKSELVYAVELHVSHEDIKALGAERIQQMVREIERAANEQVQQSGSAERN